MLSLRKSLTIAILLASTPASAFTLQEAYALKGSGKVAAELLLSASGAPKGGVTVAALAQPGQAERLLADLTTLGLEHGAAAGRLVTGRLPYAAVGRLDPLASLHSIRPSQPLFHQADDPGFGRQGSIVSKGDTELYAAAARTRFQVDGSGVTVGVLSDSYDCGGDPYKSAAATLQTGDTPRTCRYWQSHARKARADTPTKAAPCWKSSTTWRRGRRWLSIPPTEARRTWPGASGRWPTRGPR
jgi:hypothetical protein